MKMSRSITNFLLPMALLFCSAWLTAQEAQVNTWPREIAVAQGTIVVYQPQPEKLEGDILTGRAAIAIELTDEEQPIFGAVWFSARMDTDRSERTATLIEVKIDNIRIPIEDESKSKDLVALLEAEMPKWQLSISMDNLLATLEVVDAREESAESISTRPPKIIFTNKPAVLIPVDGDPQLRDIEGSDLQRVINTPFTLLYDGKGSNWYLHADGESWYSADAIQGSWSLAPSVPAAVQALAPPPPPPPEEGEEVLEEDAATGAAPDIVVMTEPTELISIDGKAAFEPVEGTQLLAVTNTESDLLMDIGGQNYYVLLSGRWYASRSLEGPWEYMPGDELPGDFAAIPEESDMSTVLYAVPGTKAAEEAVLDAQMPQTAAVERSKATLEVEYDGTPSFEEVESTSLSYAVNTATPVLRADGKYYAVDEAVWFVSLAPKGQWTVATELPAAIYTIPPESPLYYVTFVRIYKSTDDYVYVGYTPGYTNTYVYNTTVVYGTGYYYPGWYGQYYYPRYSTWGFHVRYTPWGGWRFGLSYSSGPFTFYVGGGSWYRGGWWGPARYRGYRHGYRRGYRHGYRHGARAGYAAGRRHSSGQNLYKSNRNQVRTRSMASTVAAQPRPRVSSQRANNVYTDRNGAVYRDRGGGWDKNVNGDWQKHDVQKPESRPTNIADSRPATKPEQRPASMPTQKPAQQPKQDYQRQDSGHDLNRSREARSRGNQRTQSYNRSRGGGRRR
ncbi:MAG: hypothetical protein V7746_26195 [Halioglobus sp.]